MENRNTILAELNALSPLLASLDRSVPYSVPRGYFEGLGMQVLIHIAASEKLGSDPVVGLPKDNVYKVPAGYFEALPGRVLDRVKAMTSGDPREELESLSPLLGHTDRKLPYATPTSYFGELSENIVAGIQAIDFVNGELENLPPVMNRLKERNVYEVPGGYFENFAAGMLQKVKQQPAAKVVAFRPVKSIIRYAAAALIIGFVATSAYLYFKPARITADPVAGLAKVSDQELDSFLNNGPAVAAMSGLNTINNFTANSGEISEADTKELFADISDRELQQYLEEHGKPMNPATN